MNNDFRPHPPADPHSLQGVVVTGLGEGTHFMALNWVLAQCRERLGFTPSPGTFNLRMQGQRWAQLRLALHNTKPGAKKPGIELTPPRGYCAASCFALRVAGAIDAWGIVPHIDDYPYDKLEIIAPLNIREALGLANGNQVSIEIGAYAIGAAATPRQPYTRQYGHSTPPHRQGVPE